MFAVGFLAMALIVWLSIFLSVPRRARYHAKLNAQLDGTSTSSRTPRRRDDRHPDRARTLHGRLDGDPLADRAAVLNRTPFGENDPQFGSTYRSSSSSCRSTRGILAYASAVVLIAGLAARSRPRYIPRRPSRSPAVRCASTPRPHPARDHRGASLHRRCRGAEHLVRPVRDLVDGKDVNGQALTGALYLTSTRAMQLRDHRRHRDARRDPLHHHGHHRPLAPCPIIGTALLVVARASSSARIYPAIIDRLQVAAESQGTLEAQYIERNIQATRDAYGPRRRRRRSYNAQSTGGGGALREDAVTTANIRILDHRRLADVPAARARAATYTIHRPPRRRPLHDRRSNQVPASPCASQPGCRQLDWHQQRLVYTHGYGVRRRVRQPATRGGSRCTIESGILSSGGLGEFELRVYFGENSPESSIIGAPEGEGATSRSTTRRRSRTARPTPARRSPGEARPQLGGIFTRLVYAIVPGRGDPALRPDQRRVADPLRPRPGRARREGHPVPDPRQRPVPRRSSTGASSDRRRLHHLGELLPTRPCRGCRTPSSTPTRRPTPSRSTTSTTSATR